MEINELRIGNYVSPLGIGIDKVIYIDGENNVIECEKFTERGIDYFKPIEITEEILLKSGFEKGINYFSLTNVDVDFDVDLKGWFGFDSVAANANIKFLHQLQNLYFALTDKELQVNL